MPRSMRPWHKPRVTCLSSSTPPAFTSTPTTAIQHAKEAMQKGRFLPKDCQSLFDWAIAPSMGGGAVNKYTTDDQEEDSDNKRKIEKAERAAERKAGKWQGNVVLHQ